VSDRRADADQVATVVDRLDLTDDDRAIAETIAREGGR